MKVTVLLFRFMAWAALFWSVFQLPCGYAQDNKVNVVLINPVQYTTPEAYLSPDADLIADSLVLSPNDTLAQLPHFVESEPPIIETGCFYPDLKLVYRDHTYVISTHCAGIYKFKNDTPFIAGKSRLANDFIFTESLILYLQRFKRFRLGNNNDRFFAQLEQKYPSALGQYRKVFGKNASIAPTKVAVAHVSPAKQLPAHEPTKNLATTSLTQAPKSEKPKVDEVKPPKDEYEQLFNYPTLIRKVKLRRASGDTVLYTDKTDLKNYVYFTQQNIAVKPILYTGTNEIQFEFEAPTNFKPLTFDYQWRLDGRDEDWSQWSGQKSVTISGLSAKTYKFRVRAKDNRNRVSNEGMFEFTVLPRWSVEGNGADAPYAVIRRVILKRSTYDSVLYRSNLLLATHADEAQIKKPLVLSYGDQALRFEFARPEADGSKIYQYYMENSDPAWRDWTDKNFADYTYLASGQYTFHLRLKQPNGQYSQEAIIPLIIEKPWHESSLFYGSVLGGFALLAAIGLLVQPKEKWEGKLIGGVFFAGIVIIVEIVSHQLHQSQYFDPDMTGVIKIALYALIGMLLALFPFSELLDRFNNRYYKRLRIIRSGKASGFAS